MTSNDRYTEVERNHKVTKIRADLKTVQNQINSDWERIKKGGMYDAEIRTGLFAQKRGLLNELTALLNPAHTADGPLTPDPNPVHDSRLPLLERALNVSQRMILTNQANEAADFERATKQIVNLFKQTLSQNFSLNYAEMRERLDYVTIDDPLIVGSDGVYLSYFHDDDEGSWRIQVGLETINGPIWSFEPVTNFYELGQMLETILAGDFSNTRYKHDKERS
jgi:hypothetical protein